MKHTLFFILLIGISINLTFAQNDPNVFSTVEEFQKNTPSTYSNFKLKKRTNGNVFMTGGIRNYRLKKIKPESKTEDMLKKSMGSKGIGFSLYK